MEVSCAGSHVQTNANEETASLERIKNLYIRHFLDIESCGGWNYGYYTDRQPFFLFFLFSCTNSLSWTANQNDFCHYKTPQPQTLTWGHRLANGRPGGSVSSSFFLLWHSVKSSINIHIVYCFFVKHLGFCLRWEPGELWHRETHSDFLMNLSTGPLTEERVLMVQISKQAVLVIWDCGAPPKKRLTQSIDLIKAKWLHFKPSVHFLFVNKSHSGSLKSSTCLNLMLPLI